MDVRERPVNIKKEEVSRSAKEKVIDPQYRDSFSGGFAICGNPYGSG